ncbi:MAG: nucleoside deaminase [Alphaproteobacteria bacterium]
MSESRSTNAGFMEMALQEASMAADRGEVPVGCVVVHSGTAQVVARNGNRVEEWKDPTAHAEMIALREATKAVGEARLPDCDLYVSLEPCPMCATAISFARIRRLYFGASDEKGGGVENGPRIFNQATCHHRPDVYGGIGESDAAALLKSFFAERR